jgi:DNA-binding winged helix-turn-helix (wHTH) protein
MRPESTGSAENAAPVYQFGAFEFNVRNGELRKHGLRLKLQDQPVRILAFLLENAGEVVGRDQIRARLWTSDIHVDYDNAINSAVRKLRDSLGDTAENPRFIETVARRGYRFVAPVSPKLPAAPLPSPVPAKARRWRLLAIPVALAAVVAGLAFWGAKRDTRAALNRGNVEIQPDPNRRLTAGNNRSTIVGRVG